MIKTKVRLNGKGELKVPGSYNFRLTYETLFNAGRFYAGKSQKLIFCLDQVDLRHILGIFLNFGQF